MTLIQYLYNSTLYILHDVTTNFFDIPQKVLESSAWARVQHKSLIYRFFEYGRYYSKDNMAVDFAAGCIGGKIQ